MGRFGAYGLYMGGEGVIRMALCVALASVGVHAVGFYGLAVGIPPLIAVSIAVRREHNLFEPGPPKPRGARSDVEPRMAPRRIGARRVHDQRRPDRGHVARDARREVDRRQVHDEHGDRPRAALPLPSRAGVTAAEAGVARRRRAASTTSASGLRRLLSAVAGLGVVAVVGAFLVGPLVVRILFGPDYDLGRRNLTMLAASSRAVHGRDHDVAGDHRPARPRTGGDRVGSSASIVFVVVTALGNDLLLRVEMGLVAGSATSVLALWLLLRPLTKRGGVPDEESLTEAFQDLPLEPYPARCAGARPTPLTTKNSFHCHIGTDSISIRCRCGGGKFRIRCAEGPAAGNCGVREPIWAPKRHSAARGSAGSEARVPSLRHRRPTAACVAIIAFELYRLARRRTAA